MNKTEKKYHGKCEFIRPLSPGDVIVCNGTRAEIKVVSYQEFNQQDKYIVIEFEDVNGAYRSFSSITDGIAWKYLVKESEVERNETEQISYQRSL